MTDPAKLAREIVGANSGGTECKCDECYLLRDRIDPYCRWCNFGNGCVEDITAALGSYGDERAREALEEAANLCAKEQAEYTKRMEEFDKRGEFASGSVEADCACTAQYLREGILSLIPPAKETEKPA